MDKIRDCNLQDQEVVWEKKLYYYIEETEHFELVAAVDRINEGKIHK